MPIKLTEASLRRVFPHARDSYIAALLAEQEFLAARGILDTPLTWCHFAGQIGGETGGLRIVREDMRYSAKRIRQIFGRRHSAKVTAKQAQRLAYKPYDLAERVYGIGNPSMARRLGNTEPGDGYNYRGWGPGQVTGKEQSLRYGERLGVNLEESPELLEDPAIGLKAFALEWGERGLNAWAKRNDILSVSRGVNLGNPRHRATPNGLAHRKTWFRKAWAEWRNADPNGTETPESVPEQFPGEMLSTTYRMGDEGTGVRALQERLKELGYSVGHADGVFGAETRRAVVAFQADHELTTDGIAGPATAEALDKAEPIVRAGREDLTADDLAARGSTQVDNARKTKRMGLWTKIIGWLTFGGGLAFPGSIEAVPAWISSLHGAVDTLDTHAAWVFSTQGLVAIGAVIVITLGTVIWARGQKSEDIRVREAQTGENLSK